MRRAIALLAVLAPVAALAFSVPPPPPRFLYDGANVLSGHDRQRIEERLMQLNQAGQQIAVCILPSLDGESIEDASIRIAEAWGPGQRRADDGALITVFMRDRKMRVEVGYGLESRIPDSVARQIVMDRMRPAFRSNRYGDGIMEAVDSVASAAMGQRMPQPSGTVVIPGGLRVGRETVVQGCNGGGSGCCCLLVLALLVLRAILRGVYRPRFYGFGQQAVYRPSIPWWGWLLFGNAMGSSHRHHHHHRSGWYSGGSGGSSWSGGSSGSWGGSSGGGSFGGGSFGGGGASGSW